MFSSLHRCLWVAVLGFVGCTYYGTPIQIENWPYSEAQVIHKRASWVEVRETCSRYGPWWGSVRACAVYFVDRCEAWAPEGEASDDDFAIELDNCMGRARPYWRERMIELRDEVIAKRTQAAR